MTETDKEIKGQVEWIKHRFTEEEIKERIQKGLKEYREKTKELFQDYLDYDNLTPARKKEVDEWIGR